jgi:hypothetical protein
VISLLLHALPPLSTAPIGRPFVVAVPFGCSP